MSEPTPKTPWYTAENVRFGTILLAILFAALLTRFNGCDKGQIAQSILTDPAIAELAPGQKELKASLSRVQGQVTDLSGKLDTALANQQRMAATLAAVQKDTSALVDHSPHVVYTFDPHTQEEPDPAGLGRLQGLVQGGANLSVVHKPAEGSGRSVVLDCVTAAVDTNGNVLCQGAMVSANSELPDGRRYQEVLRHDGTLTLAHWNADGSNVQGARELGKRHSIWIAARPMN